MVSATSNTWTWAPQWWGVLVAINAVNLVIAIMLFARAFGAFDPSDRRYRRTMAVLGLVFICVAMYRAIFPSSYVDQLAWFDTVLNSSLLIRCLAIFAELSFAGLIAKSLLRMNSDVPELVTGRSGLGRWLQNKAPVFLFACILTANVFATAATVTKVNVLFAIEETLWTVGFLAVIPMLLMSWRRLSANRDPDARTQQRSFRTLVVILAIFSIGYAVFQLGVNLPGYWLSALDQLQAANPDPAMQFGWKAVYDAFFNVHLTDNFSAWGGWAFVIWYTGYFSICGWIVLFMMNAPRLKAGAPAVAVNAARQ